MAARRLRNAVAAALSMGVAAPAAHAAASAPFFTPLPATGATELQSPRARPAAAALPDGKILVAGGFGGGQTAELFDPTTETFAALPASGATELQTSREGAVASSLPDGEVLIAGGYKGTDGYLRSAELFDPATETFTALAGGQAELHEARIGAVAAPLRDGKVLIADGQNTSGFVRSAELFEPTTNTFTALPATGSTELQTARKDAAAAPLPDGKVLIAGGNNGSQLRTAELFDPASETFTALPATGDTELSVVRSGAAAVPLADGKALTVGGDNSGGYANPRSFSTRRARRSPRSRRAVAPNCRVRAASPERCRCPTVRC